MTLVVYFLKVIEAGACLPKPVGLGLLLIHIIFVHTQLAHFHFAIFFACTSSKSFQTGCRCLSFLPCKVSHSKQAAVYSFLHLLLPPFQVNPSPRGLTIFTWSIFLIKTVSWSYPLFTKLILSPMILSINSSLLILFLIEKVISEISSYHTHPSFPPPLLLLPTHLTRYQSPFFWLVRAP